MKKRIIGLALFLAAFVPEAAKAHCPLCTAGAAGAAFIAAWLGVGAGAIGIWIGAFALAMGLWIARLIKKQYVPHQRAALGVLSFATTIFPLRPILSQYSSFSLYLSGDYGSLLNRTYLVNLFILGSVIGGAIMVASPFVSTWVAKKRGKTIPFQGIVLTFVLLLASSLIIEIAI